MKLLKGLEELEGIAVVKIKEDGKEGDFLEAYAVDEKCIENEKGESIIQKVGDMGSFHFCDYFYLVEDKNKNLKGYLIEETDLADTITDNSNKFIENTKEEFIKNIKDEFIKNTKEEFIKNIKDEIIKNIKDEIYEKCMNNYKNRYLSAHVKKCLVLENRCKMYASLLMMCRLWNEFKSQNKSRKNIDFYFVLLVINKKKVSSKDAFVYKNIEEKIKSDMEGMSDQLVKGQVMHSYKGFKDHINSL